jgi:hypothetical protein
MALTYCLLFHLLHSPESFAYIFDFIEYFRVVKIIKMWRLIAMGRTGRPKLRWEGDDRGDVGRIRIENWSEMTMGRVEQK